MHLTRRSTFLGILGALGPVSASAQTRGAITEYEAATGGHVGLYAENLASGARLAWRADDRFAMCSTFKASLAALVLRRVDRGDDHLDVPIAYTASDVKDWHAPVAKANLAAGSLSLGAMCAASVRESDNTCANLLLARIGGPAALTSFWRATGDGVSP
jgi:beta-lactamase class A